MRKKFWIKIEPAVRIASNRTGPDRIVLLLENPIDYLALIFSCQRVRLSARLFFAAEKPASASKSHFGPRYRKLRASAGGQYRTPLRSLVRNRNAEILLRR